MVEGGVVGDVLVGPVLVTSLLAGMVALLAPCCVSVMLRAYLSTVFPPPRCGAGRNGGIRRRSGHRDRPDRGGCYCPARGVPALAHATVRCWRPFDDRRRSGGPHGLVPETPAAGNATPVTARREWRLQAVVRRAASPAGTNSPTWRSPAPICRQLASIGSCDHHRPDRPDHPQDPRHGPAHAGVVRPRPKRVEDLPHQRVRQDTRFPRRAHLHPDPPRRHRRLTGGLQRGTRPHHVLPTNAPTCAPGPRHESARDNPTRASTVLACSQSAQSGWVSRARPTPVRWRNSPSTANRALGSPPKPGVLFAPGILLNGEPFTTGRLPNGRCAAPSTARTLATHDRK